MKLSRLPKRFSVPAAIATAVLLVAAVTVPASPADAAATPTVRFGARHQIAPGLFVQSFYFKNASGNQRAYQMTADLNVPGLSALPATASSTGTRLSKKQALSKTVKSSGAMGGINADQFDTTTSVPIGGMMINGTIFKTPFFARNVSTVYTLSDGSFHVGPVTFSGALTLVGTPTSTNQSDFCLSGTGTSSPTPTPTASPTPTPSGSSTPTSSPTAPPLPNCTVPLVSVNTPSSANSGLVLLTSALPGGALPAGNCTLAEGTVTGGVLTVASMLTNQRAYSPPPGKQQLVAGCGAFGTWLAQTAQLGNQLSLSYSLTAKGQPVRSMFSSDGLLRANGQVYNDPTRIVESGHNPETALCISADAKHLSLIAVDGREGKAAPGITVAQLQDLTTSLHCYTAVVLDGGGSTDMVMRYPGTKIKVVNHPSDRGGERAIPAALLVFYHKP